MNDIAAKVLCVKNYAVEIYEKTFKFLTRLTLHCGETDGNLSYIDQFPVKATFRLLYREVGTINDGMCTVSQTGPVVRRSRSNRACRRRYGADGSRDRTEGGAPVIVGSGDPASEAVSVGIVKTSEPDVLI